MHSLRTREQLKSRMAERVLDLPIHDMVLSRHEKTGDVIVWVVPYWARSDAPSADQAFSVVAEGFDWDRSDEGDYVQGFADSLAKRIRFIFKGD